MFEEQTSEIRKAAQAPRKIAVLFYNTLRHGIGYADPGASYYGDRYRQRVLANLKRRAKSLGYALQLTEHTRSA